MPKGFEGHIKVLPAGGWDAGSNVQGFYLYADSESLSANQEYKDRPEKITYGMVEKLNSRTKGPAKPGGDITFQPRSDDVNQILQSHFQKYIGSTLTTYGTTLFTYVPANNQPDWTGVTFGTGAYAAAEGDMYALTAQVNTNTSSTSGTNIKKFNRCFVDQIAIESAAGEDVKITASFKGKDFTLARSTTAPPDSLGSYSEKAPFEFFEGTVVVGGDSALEISNFSLTSSRNSEDRPVLGNINPTKYDFGRYTCEGVLQIDAPQNTLDHLGSMLNDSAIAISGTWFNSATDYMIVSIPNAKYQPFDVNVSAGDAQVEYGLSWKAYESNDGATAPLTVTVCTTGMGSALVVV